MRKLSHILSPIVLLTFLFPSFAYGEAVDWKDLVIRDGLYYKKFTDVPFTGNVEGVHFSGKTVSTNFKSGKVHGPWISYHENGQLWMRGSYKKGKLDGLVFVYQENGQLRKEVTGTYRLGEKID